MRRSLNQPLSKSDLEALEFVWKTFGHARDLVELTHLCPEWKKHENALTTQTRVRMDYTDFLEDSPCSVECYHLTSDNKEARRAQLKELSSIEEVWKLDDVASSGIEQLLRTTLRTGTVYYFQDRSLTSPEPHFFIVLNKEPIRDAFLVLTVSTSNIERIRTLRMNLPGTIVEIKACEYADFTKDSIIDCNYAVLRTKGQILEKMRCGEIQFKHDMPSCIVAKIIAGIAASPLLEDDIKKLIL